ncbi:MAG: ABC transporter substrate-binding protein, partial [Candidatus Rokuibacteriota bacterium]
MVRRLAVPLVALVALAAVAVPERAAAQTAPFKIGALGPLTGGAAVIGIGEVNGIKLRLKQLNYEIAGRTIELIVEDDAGDPTTGLTKAQKLIERDQVDVFLGPL